MSNQHRTKFVQEDDEFEIEKASKRSNYKKIKLNIKKEMIKKHLQDGLSISELSKLFRVSYSTIAHIINTYQQKNVIFESKQSKVLREVQQEQRRSKAKQFQQKQIKKDQKCQVKHQNVYFSFIYWPYI